MTVLLSAILPVSAIVLIGFFASKYLKLDSSTLSQISLYILSPALIADSLYKTSLSMESTTNLTIGFTISSVLLYVGVWGISKILKLSSSLDKSLIATSLFSNNGNLGLPFTAFALGASGLERAIIYMIASSILMFGFAPALLSGKGFIFGVKLTLKLPIFWAMLGGLTLRISGWELPFNLYAAIEQLSKAAIPVALLLLGVQLASTPFKVGKQETIASLIRLALAPAIAYVIGIFLHLETLDLQVLVLQSAMPTAISSLVLVKEFGGDPVWVAKTIVISTVMSLISLPVILFLMS
jgi:hypothetical protein